MKIVGDDFILTLCDTYGDFWDLSMKLPVTDKQGKTRKRFKEISYGISLEHCINNIINTRIKLSNETLSMEDYLKKYKDELNKIKKMVNGN